MIDSSRSLVPVMVLGCLETAINTLVNDDQKLLDSFAQYAGKVVRVKTHEPEMSFYFLFCTDGVQILSQFDGYVDARVRAPATTLIAYLLSPDSEFIEEWLNRDILITGNRDLVAALNNLANELNIWHLLHQLLVSWMPESVSLKDLLEALHRSDPVWIDKLQTLLLSMESVKEQLMGQSAVQQQQLQALLDIRRDLHLQQLRMQLVGVVGTLIVMVGIIGANGILPVNDFVQSVGVLNLALIVGGTLMALMGVGRIGKGSKRSDSKHLLEPGDLEGWQSGLVSSSQRSDRRQL